MTPSKSEVLKIFKALHRARLNLFKEDHEMLAAVRDSINTYFKENKSENDPEKLKELMQLGITIEDEMRTKMIQAVEIEPGRWEMRIRPENCVDDPGILYQKKNVKRK